jgi:hypothetical protein
LQARLGRFAGRALANRVFVLRPEGPASISAEAAAASQRQKLLRDEAPARWLRKPWPRTMAAVPCEPARFLIAAQNLPSANVSHAPFDLLPQHCERALQVTLHRPHRHFQHAEISSGVKSS